MLMDDSARNDQGAFTCYFETQVKITQAPKLEELMMNLYEINTLFEIMKSRNCWLKVVICQIDQ
jgi:hypothetical protein